MDNMTGYNTQVPPLSEARLYSYNGVEGSVASKHFKLIWLCNLSILSVPDEGYSGNVSCALN